MMKKRLHLNFSGYTDIKKLKKYDNLINYLNELSLRIEKHSPGITRMLKDLYNNSIDWHEILADFFNI
ncbi:MAG: hypothetical protein L6U99_10955 [Clostridium sp.]|nr:MAG: hypothetical protein L6U99_10955 [Clostridium sp.]